MTNEFYIAGDSKCLESTHHNKQKKRKKKELGEQGENQINVCKFLDGSPWSFGLVPALWSQLTSNIITCRNLN